MLIRLESEEGDGVQKKAKNVNNYEGIKIKRRCIKNGKKVSYL